MTMMQSIYHISYYRSAVLQNRKNERRWRIGKVKDGMDCTLMIPSKSKGLSKSNESIETQRIIREDDSRGMMKGEE